MKNLLLVSVLAFVSMPITLSAKSPVQIDVNNTTCRGLGEPKCKAAASCRWLPGKGNKKATCVNKAGHSQCARLPMAKCKADSKCSWIEKSGNKRAYCRIKKS